MRAAQVQIAGNRLDPGLESLRGLITGCGAEVEESLSGLQIQQRNNRLRSDVLKAKRPGIPRIESIAPWNIRRSRSMRRSVIAHPDIAFRRSQAGPCNFHCRGLAVLRDPPLEQPARC